MSGGATKPRIRRGEKIKCVNCGHATRIVNTKQISPLYREIVYECESEKCGCRFVSSLSPVRILIPPLIHNPDLNLPISSPRYRPASAAA